jgi:cardiolipin synthase
MSTAQRTSDLPKLLATGEDAFSEMLSAIATARRTLFVRAFIWRDDATGREVARAILDAAERGVRVTICKDLVGAIYEHFDENQRSFFHPAIELRERIRVRLLRLVYGRPRLPRRPTAPLARQLLEHPGIAVHHRHKLCDHSKLLIVDDETMFVGGMGFGDEFRRRWLDLMVRLDGRRHVERYAAQLAPRPCASPTRPVGFLVNARQPDGRLRFGIVGHRLRAIAETRRRLVMEMAYLGDPRITDALVDLVRRGAELTLVLSARANVVHDLNSAVVDELRRRTGAPDRLRIFHHPRMVHTKVMVFDDCAVELGSANCTPLSHDGYGETDVWVEDPGFARQVLDVVERHAGESTPVVQPLRPRLLFTIVERQLQERHRFGTDADDAPLHVVPYIPGSEEPEGPADEAPWDAWPSEIDPPQAREEVLTRAEIAQRLSRSGRRSVA